MSENSFKVPAKTPRPVKKDVKSDSVKAEAKAPARKTVKKTPAQKKQPASEKPDAPRKLKGSDLSFSKQELPALPSLANMTREERIRALSGGGEKKKPKTEEKRSALSILNPSSLKRLSGSPTALIILLYISSHPQNGSTIPFSLLYAMAFTVKSRLFKSSVKERVKDTLSGWRRSLYSPSVL